MSRKAVSNKLLKACFVAIVLFVGPRSFGMVTIDFEGMPDMALVTNQYAPLGVNFQGGIILTAYSSLNVIDFPPHSGSQVLGNKPFVISADFSTPVSYVGAWFTYTTQVNLAAYDSSDLLITSTWSLANNNYGTSEFISLSSISPISRLTIVDEGFGSVFIMDDFQFQPVAAVPAPGALLLGSIGMAIVSYVRRRNLL
jgi:hypothetical protein